MNKCLLIKILAIIIAIEIAFSFNFVQVFADTADKSITRSKISSLLSMHIKLKEAQAADAEQGILKSLGDDFQSQSEATLIDTERVFLHFIESPTTAQLDELNSLGVTVYSDSWIPPVNDFNTGFVLADMPVDKLNSLAEKNYIVTMDTAEQTLSPQNDQARAAMNVGDVWSGGYNGTGVTVAVLDSGLDTTNPDFPAPVAAVDYSNYPNKDTNITNNFTGHGTHVTGSLLGRGVHSALYKGVAPGASLVFLKIGDDTTGAASSDAVVYAIRDAVDIYHARIINLSYGTWSQYHDGSDQACQAVDYATSQGATVFVASGNEGSSGWHDSVTVDANTTSNEIVLSVATGASSTLPFELVWSDGLNVHNNLRLQYYDSNHSLLSSTNGNQSESSKSGVECIISQLDTAVDSGTYYLRVQNSGSQQFIHLYYLGGLSQVAFSHPDGEYTIDSPAEADSAIAVGAYVTRSSWTNYQGSSYSLNPSETAGSAASFSSCGPRVDNGAPIKPDIVAPGTAIISVRDPLYTLGNTNYDPGIIDDDGNGLGPNNTGPANYIVNAGTSMASPMAAGVGALLLSKNPNLTPAQIRHTLELSAIDIGNYGRDSKCGWGLVNSRAAKDADTVLQSYCDVDHMSECNNYTSFSTQNAVYISGSVFLPYHKYRVAYYDGSNQKVASEDIISNGPADGSLSGTGGFSSQHTFAQGIDTTGIWHVIVCEPIFTPPADYQTSWAYTIDTKSFTVQNSAIYSGYIDVATNEANYTVEGEATLNATLITKGDANNVAVSFEYGLTTNYGTNVLCSPATLSEIGKFSAIITGLIPGKLYHFRARADGGMGYIVTSSDFSFYTWSPPLKGRIVFSSNRNGDFEIYSMNADGSNQARLTNSSHDDLSPSLSPDSSKIAFISGRNGLFYQIYLMNIDGSNQTALSTGTSDSTDPTWSPDGTKIAYTTGGNIWIMNADGSNQTQITSGYQPSWSPDGTKIAFMSVGSIYTQIFTININGTNRICLTNDTYHCHDPSWSPDGLHIAYQSQDTDGFTIMTMNQDGANPVKLANLGTENGDPTWSPDGSKIAFISNRYNNAYQIYVMNSDGTNQRRLAASLSIDRHPSWGTVNLNNIVFTTIPKTIVAGSISDAISVQLTDNSGDPINFTIDIDINLTSTSSTGKFDIDTKGSFDGSITKVTISRGSSQADFYYKDTKAGTPTITATCMGDVSCIQQETVNAAAASKVTVVTEINGIKSVVQPQNIAIGRSLKVYAFSCDTYNNFIANLAADSWSLANPTGGVVSGDLVPATDNRSAVFTGHSLGTAAIHITSGSLTPFDSGTLTVVPGPASVLIVSDFPSPATAGTANNFKVTAKDQAGNTATDYTGKVHFTCSDVQTILPADYTFTVSDKGTHTFIAVMKTAGSQSLTAADTANASITGTQSSIMINSAGKNKLVWGTQPPSTVITGAVWAAFTVKITDQYGNQTADNDNITITPSSGSLSGTLSQTAVAGLATFNDISRTLVGNLTLSATSGTLTSTPASSPVIVNPVPAPPSGGSVGGSGGGGTSTRGILTFGLTAKPDFRTGFDGIIQNNTLLTTDDGMLTFNIAQNTQMTNAKGMYLKTFTATRLTTFPQPPPESTVVLAYQFDPEGALFNPPIILTVSLKSLELLDELDGVLLTLAYWNGSVWVTVDSKIDPVAGTLTAELSHFSQYALISKPLPPAAFTISDIKVTPAEVNLDQEVTVQSVVSNTGGRTGSCQLILKVDGIQADSRDISLDAGETRTISFELKRSSPGEYSVDLNGNTGKFIVLTPTPAPTPTPSPERTVIPTSTQMIFTPLAEAIPMSLPVLTTAPPDEMLVPSASQSTPADPEEKKKTSIYYLWIVLGGLVIIAGLVTVSIYAYRKISKPKSEK